MSETIFEPDWDPEDEAAYRGESLDYISDDDCEDCFGTGLLITEDGEREYCQSCDGTGLKCEIDLGEKQMKYFWKQCYKIGDDIHWALCDTESEKENRVTSTLLVLHHSLPKYLGQEVESQHFMKKIIGLLNNDHREILQLKKEIERLNYSNKITQATSWNKTWKQCLKLGMPDNRDTACESVLSFIGNLKSALTIAEETLEEGCENCECRGDGDCDKCLVGKAVNKINKLKGEG